MTKVHRYLAFNFCFFLVSLMNIYVCCSFNFQKLIKKGNFKKNKIFLPVWLLSSFLALPGLVKCANKKEEKEK